MTNYWLEFVELILIAHYLIEFPLSLLSSYYFTNSEELPNACFKIFFFNNLGEGVCVVGVVMQKK